MSNYALAVRFSAEPLRSLAFGSISGTYAGIGTVFEHPIRLIYVQNLTDKTLVFSFDGINDHFKLPEQGFLLLDVSSNKTQQGGWFIAEGQRIYVKDDGVAASAGEALVSAFYGSTGYEE